MNYMDETVGMPGMEMETESRVSMPLCDRVMNHEVSGDFTLPDYHPEIRRLLAVTETVLPPARYIGGGNVEFNGTVDYRILYVGGDGELYTAPLSSEYGFSAPLESGGREFDLTEGVSAFVSTSTDHLSTRVTGPRKLSIRHRLCSHVRAYGQMILSEKVSGSVDEATVQRLSAEARRACVAGAVSEPIALRAELAEPAADARVISADPCVFVSSVDVGDGRLSVSGEVILKVLWCREEGVPETILKKIPFEGEIEGEGFVPGASARARGAISDLSVSVEEGKILCDAVLLLEGRSMYDLPLRYTEDLYSTETDCVCDYAEHQIPVSLKCENRNLSQSERMGLSEARLPEGAEICDVWGRAQFDSCETVGERAVLSGQSRYSILCRKDGDYSVTELNLPLRFETDGMSREASAYDASAEVISCRVRTDGETLYLDAELAICADFMGSEEIRCVSEVRFGEKSQKRSNCMIVYYPVPGDTPWSVAKKYQVPQAELSGDLSSYFIF